MPLGSVWLVVGGIWREWTGLARVFPKSLSQKNAHGLIRCGDAVRRSGKPPSVVAMGRFMPSFKVLFALIVPAALWAQIAAAQGQFGPQGAEGEPNREQQWLVPSPDPGTAAHA